MRTVGHLARDVRALGPTAPVRAAYELSKRAGGHRLLFGALRVATPGPPRTVLSPPGSVPEQARLRAVADADEIVRGWTPVFGRPVDLAACSHTAPDSGGDWSTAPWWQVDIRSEDRLADVKWTWELGRHRHLLVLARAAWLEPGQEQYLEALVRHLAEWVRENPPERGVHWYSNLEIALRALVWLQLLPMVEARLPPQLRDQVHHHLLHSGAHLVADLPYTVSSMRNNHLLGDGLGLIALGTAFDRPKWQGIGNRLFDSQLRRHMRPDGSMIEDSLSYHRFVTEMLALRVLLGHPPRPVQEALAASGAYLARLGVLDGPVPQFGDWDEGRVLGSSADPLDVAGCAALALALSGTGSPEPWRERFDECAWYAPSGLPAAVPAAEASGGGAGGGFARGVQAGWTGYLKAGGGTSHQHADLCSAALMIDGQWVVGDPGTGTYNGPLEQRNAFRTSGAHCVLRLQEADQLQPHRAFRWLGTARGVVGPAPALPGCVVMWGAHDAYQGLAGGGRTARLIVLTEGALTVADVCESPPGARWDLTLPLHPGVVEEAGRLLLPDGSALELDLPAEPVRVRGQTEPYAGWWSDTYGSAVPATWLQMSGSVAGAVVWAVRRPGQPGARGLVDGLKHEGTDLRVSFTPTSVVLTVSGGQAGDQVLYAPLGRQSSGAGPMRGRLTSCRTRPVSRVQQP